MSDNEQWSHYRTFGCTVSVIRSLFEPGKGIEQSGDLIGRDGVAVGLVIDREQRYHTFLIGTNDRLGIVITLAP